LSGRSKQIHAIEIREAGHGCGIGIGGEPLARIPALKRCGGKGRALKEIARQGVLAGTVLAFNGGDLEMRRGHFRLH